MSRNQLNSSRCVYLLFISFCSLVSNYFCVCYISCPTSVVLCAYISFNTDISFVFSLSNWKQSSISAITQGMDLWKFCCFWSKRNGDRLVLQKLNCSTSIFMYELSLINPALSTLKLYHIVVIIYIWDTHVYYTHLGTLKCKLTNQCVLRWLYRVYRMLSISV